MTAHVIRGFRGEVPLMAPHLLPDVAAQSAVNARLYTGDLTAFRQFLMTQGLANTGPVQTISLMAGEIASLLISRMAVPVLYFMARRRSPGRGSVPTP